MTRVVEIEAETRKIHEYTGTWSEYEAARERARAQHERVYADYLGERSRYTELLRIRREEAHLLGGERKLARRTGGSDRRGHERAARQGQSGEEPPRAARGGREAVVPVAAAARRSPTVAARWRSRRGAGRRRGRASGRSGSARSTLELHWGDRLAVVGPNGSGKTTLIAALLGELPARCRVAAARAGGRVRRAEPGARSVLGRPPRRLRRGIGAAARPRHARCSRSSRSAPDDIVRPAPRPLSGRTNAGGAGAARSRGASTA